MRNKVTAKLRSDTIKQNGSKIEEAKDENEIWKIINNIKKPRSESEWKIKIEDKTTIDELDNSRRISLTSPRQP